MAATGNDMTTRQLLSGFFDFFANLDYTDCFLSLFKGGPVKIAEFDQDPDFEYYRELVKSEHIKPMKIVDNCLMIQDGFKLLSRTKQIVMSTCNS